MKFASFKNARVVRSAWLEKGGRRLDCNPYMSGALEARDALDSLKFRKDPLHTLTAGYAGGIFNGPMFARQWVDDPSSGVLFLSGSDVLHADLSSLPFIKSSYAKSSKLRHLEVKEGMTLITCSGTIGRMTYVRSDMAGMWSSQHIMKVVPDADKILPGYLYAFLSSRYGVPLVVAGTYGAIIQHIEPEHIYELPVPRITKIEKQVHEFVNNSAQAFVQYAELLKKARQDVLEAIGLEDPTPVKWFESLDRFGWAENKVTSESMRAYNYDPRVKNFLDHLCRLPNEPLGYLCDPNHFKGHTVFKRIASDPEYGYKLLGQREAFQMRPEGRWISCKSVAGLGLVVPPQTVLIPSHGTLGESELYCRAVYVTQRTSNNAFSGDFYRCIPLPGKIRGGYLYAFLSTKVGFRILRSMSTGGKQQYQHPSMLARFPIPRLEESEENRIADLVDEAALQYDLGLGWEDQARELVENAISGAE